MIQPKPEPPAPEPAAGRPVAPAPEWPGHRASPKPRLWERLNPRHRKQLLLLARAMALRQAKARLPEEAHARLGAALDQLERLCRRVEEILSAVASRKPPPG